MSAVLLLLKSSWLRLPPRSRLQRNQPSLRTEFCTLPEKRVDVGQEFVPSPSRHGRRTRGHHHLVLSNNPRLDNSPVLWLSKRKSPWTLPGWCLAFQMSRQTRAKMRKRGNADNDPFHRGANIRRRLGLSSSRGMKTPTGGRAAAPAGGTAYDNDGT